MTGGILYLHPFCMHIVMLQSTYSLVGSRPYVAHKPTRQNELSVISDMAFVDDDFCSRLSQLPSAYYRKMPLLTTNIH